MISFSLYCDIENHLAQYKLHRDLPLCIENLAEYDSADDSVFEALVDQCDLQTLRQLIDYFDPEAPIQDMLRKRMMLLNGNVAGNTENKAYKRAEEGFFLYLVKCIEEKGYSTDADFYNYIGVSRQRFSKLRKDSSSISREFTLHLAVGLELDYEQSAILLQKAGYSLKPSNSREAIISYVMRNQKYTFSQMNEILYLFDEKTFIETE